MKFSLIIKKTLFNDFLALALACVVSLLFTQSTTQLYKNTKTKEEICLETAGYGNAKSTNPESKSNKSSSDSDANAGVGSIAVLNNPDRIFQLRDDFRYYLNNVVNQDVTVIKLNRQPRIQTYKISSLFTFSKPIFHCQLLI